jgi:hypothetical protein
MTKPTLDSQPAVAYAPRVATSRLGLLDSYVRRLRAQPARKTLAKLANPAVIRRHATRLVRGKVLDASNEYTPSFSEAAEVEFCAAVAGVSAEAARAVYVTLDGPFEQELVERYASVRDRPLTVGRFRTWWTLVRLLKPNVVVETGVHDGLSTAIVLAALETNGHGRLISIDLPSTDLPPGVDSAGWLVSDRLRGRWTLIVGDAKALLPQVAAAEDGIDLFIHDSDHSESHQRFEYEAVRMKLSAGAVVLSDQDYPHETALSDFAAMTGGSHLRVRTTAGDPGNYAGAVRLGDHLPTQPVLPAPDSLT